MGSPHWRPCTCVRKFSLCWGLWSWVGVVAGVMEGRGVHMFVCGWLCSSLWWGEKASRLDPCASIHTCERSSGSWDSNKRTCARGLFGYSWVSDANEWNSGCRLMSTWSSTSRPATSYLASSTRFVLETVLTADQYKDVQGLKQHKNIPSHLKEDIKA